MIYQLPASYQRAQQLNTPTAPSSLEDRLALPQVSDRSGASNPDGNIDQLYSYLMSIWGITPDMDSPELIEHIRKFVAIDGSTPYKFIPTHTGALAQLLAMVKTEAGEESPFYAMIYKGLGSAVVANGIFNSFTMKMLERPEDPEPW